MADRFGVAGEPFQTLGLRLDQERFVEWVLVREGRSQRCGGMSDGQWQQVDVLPR